MSDNILKVEVRGFLNGFPVSISSDVPEKEGPDVIARLIETIQKLGGVPTDKKDIRGGTAQEIKQASVIEVENPLGRLATDIGVDSTQLKGLIGYKGSAVQISRASQIKIGDALCMLLYAFEKGLCENSIPFDEFDSLVQMNGIKLSYPLTTGVFNIRQSGYINESLYEKERKLSLTPKGEENARKAFQKLVEGKARKRTAQARKRSQKKKAKAR